MPNLKFLAHQPSLVAGSRADPVQARCHGVQSATWKCTKLPRATCRALRSAGMNRIVVPPVTSTTVGSRAFPVAASLIWNSLPDDVISAESLPTFQRKLQRHLFCQSFPGFCYWHLHLQWTLQWQCHLGHYKNDWFIDLFTHSRYMEGVPKF